MAHHRPFSSQHPALFFPASSLLSHTLLQNQEGNMNNQAVRRGKTGNEGSKKGGKKKDDPLFQEAVRPLSIEKNHVLCDDLAPNDTKRSIGPLRQKTFPRKRSLLLTG
jgi:hypothetical protein